MDSHTPFSPSFVFPWAIQSFPYNGPTHTFTLDRLSPNSSSRASQSQIPNLMNQSLSSSGRAGCHLRIALVKKTFAHIVRSLLLELRASVPRGSSYIRYNLKIPAIQLEHYRSLPIPVFALYVFCEILSNSSGVRTLSCGFVVYLLNDLVGK